MGGGLSGLKDDWKIEWTGGWIDVCLGIKRVLASIFF